MPLPDVLYAAQCCFRPITDCVHCPLHGNADCMFTLRDQARRWRRRVKEVSGVEDLDENYVVEDESEVQKWKAEYGNLRASVNAMKTIAGKRVFVALSNLDDQVARKYDEAGKNWKYTGKYGSGFRDALLAVRSMIHAAKERERTQDA